MKTNYSRCTSKNFIKDIDELCTKCPIKDNVIEEIQKHRGDVLSLKRQLLKKDKYREFLMTELDFHIKDSSKILEMEFERRNNPNDFYRANRIYSFLLRKEWIKILSDELAASKDKDNIPRVIYQYSRPNRTDIAYCIHYLWETKSLKIVNHFPSDKGWREIGQLYNKNPKNIQQAFNKISSNREYRLSKSKITNIEYVIDNLLIDFPLAAELAKLELNTAYLNS